MLLLVAATAWAEPAPRAHLVYVRDAGAEQCPDEAAMRGAVAARLGYDPFGEKASLTVSVMIAPSGQGLRAQIDLLDASSEAAGSRELTSPRRDCAELASATELAIAIAIDPLRVLPSPPEPAPAPAPENPAPPAATVAAPTVAATATETKTRTGTTLTVRAPAANNGPGLGVWTGVSVLGTVGSAAAPVAVGFALDAALYGSWWAVDLEVRGDPPASQQYGHGQVSTALVAVTLAPCVRLARAVVVTGCLLGTGGAQFGAGEGFLGANNSATTPIGALGARVGVELPLGRVLAFFAQLDGRFNLVRTHLTVDGQDAFVTPLAAGALALGLRVHFR